MVPEVIAKRCPNQQRFQDSAQPQNNKEEPSSIKEDIEKNENTAVRFWSAGNSILLSSYLNFLLVFVPVGIAVHFAGLNPIYVFAFNAIAIVPLAGLLSHATESVARRMGDTVGALVNITFGNAVELIILYVVLSFFQAQTNTFSMYVSNFRFGKKIFDIIDIQESLF
ncbi:Bgt-3262 [Blumeria graminis f. sp. tritici]|uniref:Vacuolar H+-Ca2+ exchanger n=2 Tax=Blumeria graminis f. sp. tritici TaxID=62690 RepID=A0A656KIZ0_BLUGR|nr:Vacuolar H+-Ca2+ exchanger [Blumeria graminis f. sp. tritici 96224]VDB83937.1 Bgt-3262 [Blumeria graminis f. sp. tritici]